MSRQQSNRARVCHQWFRHFHQAMASITTEIMVMARWCNSSRLNRSSPKLRNICPLYSSKQVFHQRRCHLHRQLSKTTRPVRLQRPRCRSWHKLHRMLPTWVLDQLHRVAHLHHPHRLRCQSPVGWTWDRLQLNCNRLNCERLRVHRRRQLRTAETARRAAEVEIMERSDERRALARWLRWWMRWRKHWRGVESVRKTRWVLHHAWMCERR